MIQDARWPWPTLLAGSRSTMSSSSAAAATSACRLSLVLRRCRPAGRHLRHEPEPTLERIAVRSRCRSWRTAPTSCSREVLRDRPPRRFSATPAMIGRTDVVIVVIGTPVDEFLGPSMTIFEQAVDQIAPHLVDGALVVLRSTVYPGDDGVRDRTHWPSVAVESTSPSVRSGSPRATPSRSSARCPRSSARIRRSAGDRAEALFRTPDRAGRSGRRSREAELAKLFTNTWRYMKFAIANQFFMIADQAGVDYDNVLSADPRGLPARRRPARARLRRRTVPVQGHDAAGGLHQRPLPDGPGGDAGQRGAAGLHRHRRSSVATAACRAGRSGSSGWPSRRSPTTPARR